MPNERNRHTNACPAFSDRLVDLSDGDLPPSERQAVHLHLATCPGCRAELARLNHSLSCLQGAIGRPATVALAQRGRSPAAWPVATAVGLGAVGLSTIGLSTAAVLLIGIATFWQTRGQPTGQSSPIARSPESPAATAVVSAPKMSEREALWQITLNEQRARLQTSLELLPRDDWNSDQRRETERIVDKLREAASSSGANL
jgi:anti-sigma factor RsiW